MAKKCFKCNVEKPLRDFYRHPKMADGRLGKCKECTKKDVSENYRKNRAHYVLYDRQRTQTPERRAKMIDYQRKRRSLCPEKAKAWRLTTRAIQCGRLTRMPCEVCGNPESEAHHDDYSKPLEVRWLCFKHHREHHGQTVTEIAELEKPQ